MELHAPPRPARAGGRSANLERAAAVLKCAELLRASSGEEAMRAHGGHREEKWRRSDTGRGGGGRRRNQTETGERGAWPDLCTEDLRRRGGFG